MGKNKVEVVSYLVMQTICNQFTAFLMIIAIQFENKPNEIVVIIAIRRSLFTYTDTQDDTSRGDNYLC